MDDGFMQYMCLNWTSLRMANEAEGKAKLAKVRPLISYKLNEYSAYKSLYRARKGWRSVGTNLGWATRNSRNIDRHWYRSGAMVAGSIRWRTHRKLWKVWGWQK